MREKRILGMLFALLVCLTTMAQSITMKFNLESLSSVFKKIEKIMKLIEMRMEKL